MNFRPVGSEALAIARLKDKVLPSLFDGTGDIGAYGAAKGSADAITAISDLMERGAVGQLARRIEEIVSRLQDANPEQITRRTTWLDRMTGKSIERRVRYDVARKGLDQIIEDSEINAQGVRETIAGIDRLLIENHDEVERLKLHIRAGREFLTDNPTAGVAKDGAMEFERPRDRLSRKIANLSTLLVSLEMSLAQMKLARAQAVDMLDRFNETVTVLVPIWRHHTLALVQATKLTPTMIAEATKVHKDLIRSLAKSLEGMET